MNKYLFLSITFILIVFGSCGKAIEEDFGVNNSAQYSQVYCAKAINGAISCNLEIPKDTTFHIYATLGGIRKLEKNLTVTFEVDSTLLDSYNENNNTDYQILPANCYSIIHNQVTIRKDSTYSDAMAVSVKTENLPGVGPFLLPVYLKSISNPAISINENLSKIYILINGTYVSNPFNVYDRTGWRVVDYSSFTNTSNEKDYPEYVLDGDYATFWASSYTPIRLTPPHSIVVDMQKDYTVRGFKIRARTNSMDVMNVNGEPKSITIYVSNDNINWVDAGTYNLPYEKETECFLRYHYSAQYIKVQVNSCYSGADNEFYQTAISELNIF